MEIRRTTEAFLETLKETYFSNAANEATEFLRGECRLLSYLNIDKDKSFKPSELSKQLNITTPRTASLIKTLEKKGYITRQRSDKDKREAYIKITESGIKYIEDKREKTCCLFDRAFIKLNETERSEFIRILSKLLH
ncbi:MAG: MarR family transcriptional regulator [Ruminococcus sp.]|nr:MarR family transcriptional regulator [Ruminococcus sp.]